MSAQYKIRPVGIESQLNAKANRKQWGGDYHNAGREELHLSNKQRFHTVATGE